MFKPVKTHKKFTDIHGDEHIPVITLQERGVRTKTCHIVIDEDCYVVYIEAEGVIGFVPTHYLFPEVHAALATLPPLNDTMAVKSA